MSKRKLKKQKKGNSLKYIRQFLWFLIKIPYFILKGFYLSIKWIYKKIKKTSEKIKEKKLNNQIKKKRE